MPIRNPITESTKAVLQRMKNVGLLTEPRGEAETEQKIVDICNAHILPGFDADAAMQAIVADPTILEDDIESDEDTRDRKRNCTTLADVVYLAVYQRVYNAAVQFAKTGEPPAGMRIL